MPANHQLTLLLLPGLVCDARLWRHQMDELSGLVDIQVAALSGFETMEELAQNALAQCPEGPIVLAGLSMGGYTAFEIIRQAPERVVGLALLDSSARADTEQASARRRELIEEANGDYSAVIAAMLPTMVRPAMAIHPDIGACFTRMALSAGPEVFIRQQKAILSRKDSLPLLPQIRCPSLVICGRDDALTPVELHEEMAELLPESKLVLIDDCGHLSALDQAAAVSTALRDWLRDVRLVGR